MLRYQTRYPIVLLHGMGFHDGMPGTWYWGRIPEILRQNGTKVYFGNLDGNATIASNAKQLVPVVQKILKETGAEKVNMIGHSKGGLEARYFVSSLGMGHTVASVTTIGSPHHGSITIDKLLAHLSLPIYIGSALTDSIRRHYGDQDPHTFDVIRQLSTDYMRQFNRHNPDDPKVYYQSFAFAMQSSLSDPFMSIPNAIVSLFEGENDGMITPQNARWTNFRGVYRGTSKRGISHPDEVDYLRRRFSKQQPNGKYEISDMTAFYLSIVKDLKRRGF